MNHDVITNIDDYLTVEKLFQRWKNIKNDDLYKFYESNELTFFNCLRCAKDPKTGKFFYQIGDIPFFPFTVISSSGFVSELATEENIRILVSLADVEAIEGKYPWVLWEEMDVETALDGNTAPALESIQIINGVVQKPSNGDYFTGEKLRKFLELSPTSFIEWVSRGIEVNKTRYFLTIEGNSKDSLLYCPNDFLWNEVKYLSSYADWKIHYLDLQRFLDETHFLENSSKQSETVIFPPIDGEETQCQIAEVEKLLAEAREKEKKTNGVIQMLEKEINQKDAQISELKKEYEPKSVSSLPWYGLIAIIEKMRMEGKTAIEAAEGLRNLGLSFAQIGALLHPTGEITDFLQYGKDLVAGKTKTLAW